MLKRISIILSASVICYSKSPKIAILPLQNRGIDVSESQLISDGFANAFVHVDSVRVMERTQMNEILKEQGFEKTGVCDSSECAVSTGKILGIDQIITGSIGKYGDLYILNARRISISSGEILASVLRRENMGYFTSNSINDIANELMNKKVPLPSKSNYQASTPASSQRIINYSSQSVSNMQHMIDSMQASSMQKNKQMADSLAKMWAPGAANASTATNGQAAVVGTKALEEAIKKAHELAKSGYKSDSNEIEK